MKKSKLQYKQSDPYKIINKTNKKEEMIQNLNNRLDQNKKAIDYFLKV